MNHLLYLMDKRLAQFAFDLFCKFFLTNQEYIIPSSFLYDDLFTIKTRKAKTN